MVVAYRPKHVGVLWMPLYVLRKHTTAMLEVVLFGRVLLILCASRIVDMLIDNTCLGIQTEFQLIHAILFVRLRLCDFGAT